MATDRTEGEVWVFAEQEEGRLSDVPRELLGKGRELADRLGVPLAAVLMLWAVRSNSAFMLPSASARRPIVSTVWE